MNYVLRRQVAKGLLATRCLLLTLDISPALARHLSADTRALQHRHSRHIPIRRPCEPSKALVVLRRSGTRRYARRFFLHQIEALVERDAFAWLLTQLVGETAR